MKIATVALLACLTAVPSAFAQNAGPFYLKSEGFCNVREMYLNAATSVVFGQEVGCASTMGFTFAGYFDSAGSKLTLVRNATGVTSGVNTELALSVYALTSNRLDLYSTFATGVSNNNPGNSYSISTVKPAAASLVRANGLPLPNHDAPSLNR